MNRPNTFARAAILAGLAASGLALSTPSFAADSDALPRGTLSLRGADFTAPHSVAHIKRELRHVAMDICAPDASGNAFMSHDGRVCYETAMRDGLAQIASRQEQAMRDRAVRLAATPITNKADD